MGLRASPLRTMSSSSSQVLATPPPGAAQGVSGADHQGQAYFPGQSPRLIQRHNRAVARFRLAQFVQEPAKEVAVLGLANGVQLGAEHPHPVAFQHAGVSQRHGQVQPRLSAQGGQDSVGAFLPDDPFQDVNGQGLYVDAVGDPLVRHDGGGVGVDQYGHHAFLAEGLAGLGARIVELCRLANDDRAGAYYQHFFRPARTHGLLGGPSGAASIGAPLQPRRQPAG